MTSESGRSAVLVAFVAAAAVVLFVVLQDDGDDDGGDRGDRPSRRRRRQLPSPPLPPSRRRGDPDARRRAGRRRQGADLRQGRPGPDQGPARRAPGGRPHPRLRHREAEPETQGRVSTSRPTWMASSSSRRTAPAATSCWPRSGWSPPSACQPSSRRGADGQPRSSPRRCSPGTRRPTPGRQAGPADPGLAVRVGRLDRPDRLVRGAVDRMARARGSGGAMASPAAGGFRPLLLNPVVEGLGGLVRGPAAGRDRLLGARGDRGSRSQLRPDLRLRHVLAGLVAAERPLRRRLPGLQPVAGDRPRVRRRSSGWSPGSRRRRRSPTPSASGTGPPSRGSLALRLAGAGLRSRTERRAEARDRRDRRARLLGDHLRRRWRCSASRSWIERGETFSVYFRMFSRLSVFEVRTAGLGCRHSCPALRSGDGARVAGPGPGHDRRPPSTGPRRER